MAWSKEGTGKESHLFQVVQLWDFSVQHHSHRQLILAYENFRSQWRKSENLKNRYKNCFTWCLGQFASSDISKIWNMKKTQSLLKWPCEILHFNLFPFRRAQSFSWGQVYQQLSSSLFVTSREISWDITTFGIAKTIKKSWERGGKGCKLAHPNWIICLVLLVLWYKQ